MAGTLLAGYAMGKTANWGANKLKNLANKALPKLKTAVQEGAGKFTSNISKGLGVSGSGHISRNRGFVINPFYKGSSKTTRVGRWMSEGEYNKMLSTNQVQMSGDNKVHVANPADIDAFSKQAPKGSVYVEFDVPSNTVFLGGKDGWGIIAGPGSLYDRLNVKKGLPTIEEMPKTTNIELKEKNKIWVIIILHR